MTKHVKVVLLKVFLLVGIAFNQTLVSPGDGTLAAAIDSAVPGEVLQLVGGAEYTHSASSILGIIDKPITIRVAPGSTEMAVIKFADSSATDKKYYIFSIMNGASLILDGLDINGFIDDSPIVMSMILFDGSPDPTQAKIGTIRIDNCIFHDFKDNVFHGMKEASMMGMIQDSLIINDVLVYNVDAFLQYKHVSLRYLELKNSTMFKLRSMAIKIGKERYRGYTKISPTAFIDHCTFDDMGGAHGHIQVDDAFFPFTVTNSIISNIQDPTVQPGLFMNNAQIEPSVYVNNTCFWNSGITLSPVEPYWPGYVFQDSITLNPTYQNANSGIFALPNSSPLLTFGTEGGQIGDQRWGTYTITNINHTENLFPGDFYLFQNYPNPFNSTTTIEFAIQKNARVQLILYDIHGSIIATLVNKELYVGNYSVKLNTKDISSGIYFYSLNVDGKVKIKKLTLLK